MKYRRLGRSGVKVSEIALGSWLTYGAATDTRAAEKCIETAYDLGINFFDTANAYNFGEAEQVVGKVLNNYDRSSYFLATKVYFPMGDGPNDRGLSRKHIVEQCNASLKRLGVNYIDLYQFHRFDTESDLEETLRAVDDLITQGKVLYAGVSEWSGVQITEALHLQEKYNLDKFISNQPIYNMLVRYIEQDVLPVSEHFGLGQVVFSPLAQGILTGKYKPGAALPTHSRASDDNSNHWIKSYLNNEVLGGVEKLEQIAQNLGVKLSQLALAWVLRTPLVSSAIIGASRPEQVIENVKAVDIELDETVLNEIDAVLQTIPANPIW